MRFTYKEKEKNLDTEYRVQDMKCSQAAYCNQNTHNPNSQHYSKPDVWKPFTIICLATFSGRFTRCMHEIQEANRASRQLKKLQIFTEQHTARLIENKKDNCTIRSRRQHARAETLYQLEKKLNEPILRVNFHHRTKRSIKNQVWYQVYRDSCRALKTSWQRSPSIHKPQRTSVFSTWLFYDKVNLFKCPQKGGSLQEKDKLWQKFDHRIISALLSQF